MALSNSMAKRYFQAIESAVEAFNRRWTKDVVEIGMFRMPVYQKGKPRDIVPMTIAPTLVTGTMAVQVARAGISGFQRQPDQHPSSVVRYPAGSLLSHR